MKIIKPLNNNQKNIRETERMLTEHEVAEQLNIKVSTLRSWRVKGSPLKFCRFGRSIRYSPQAVRDFLSDSVYSSTTEADHAE